MENTKKLYRDTQHKVIGGVCSGLANYFGIEVTLVRVLFAIALLAFSTGFWIYVILWIVMPAAKASETQAFAEVVEGQDGKEAMTNKSALTTGLVFIFAGLCFLLGNLIPQFTWKTFWPILLIAVGVVLIVPSKEKKS